MPYSRVLLYVPELIWARIPADSARMPLLEKFLCRAHVAPVKSAAAVLMECFGLPAEDFPVAALERLGDSGIRDRTCWWRADPAHLLADRDQLVMVPQASLAVTLGEMRQIAETFNMTYAAEGYRLEFPEAERGYLQVPADWHCHSWNPASIANQAVTEFMPSGPDEMPVRKLMTEIQMLLYEHPVNLAREAAGRPAINTLWLWGGGHLPEQVTRSPARVIAGLPLARGLAKLAGKHSESWSADLNLSWVSGDELIALSLHDFGGDVARLERELVAPIWRAVRRGRIRQVHFYPGGKRVFALTRRTAFQFWRRARPLLELWREPDDAKAD